MSKSPSILFASRSVKHFSYYQSILKHLLESNAHVTIVFMDELDFENLDPNVQSFANTYDNCDIQQGLKRPEGKVKSILKVSRESLSVINYLNRPEQSKFYLKRWLHYLPKWLKDDLKRSYVKALFKSKPSRWFLEWLEKLSPAANNIKAHIKKIAPDFLIATPVNMRFSEEVEYLKAAKALGIPSAIPVLSWDNLTTKGLFHVLPDYLLAWNHAHFDEAQSVHRMSKHQVSITGAPFFDKWFDTTSLVCDREAFCEKMGLDTARPFLLYMGSSANIATDETWVIEELWEKMKSHFEDKTLPQILVRPHPANVKNYTKFFESNDIIVYPKEGKLADDGSSISDFYNSVTHAVASLAINTSGMIDAIVIGKPVMALICDKYSKTQKLSQHFQHLNKSGALHICHDSNDVLNHFDKILSGQDEKTDERTRFCESFVFPHGRDLSAGQVAASVVLDKITTAN